MKSEKCKFALIGSGRVASHLAPALIAGGMECVAVYSPTYSNAEALASKVGSKVMNLPKLVANEVDFVLLSVKDDAITEVTKAFPIGYPSVVLHTSGSTSIDALAPIKHRGVLYPMQTFSLDRDLCIPDIPIFTEATDEFTLNMIGRITHVLGSKEVHPLSSDERVKLHLASVFACNFVNHLYAQADRVMKSIGLDFSLLAPLVEETLSKAIDNAPHSVQTGPATRKDQKTIDRHLALLQGDAHRIYEVITQSIIHEQFPD